MDSLATFRESVTQGLLAAGCDAVQVETFGEDGSGWMVHAELGNHYVEFMTSRLKAESANFDLAAYAVDDIRKSFDKLLRPPAADARQAATEKPDVRARWSVANSPMGSTSVVCVEGGLEYVIDNEIDAILLSDLHNAAIAEIERLQGELARLESIIEDAGGACAKCGHVEDTHSVDEWGYSGSCNAAECMCEAFTPRQAPAEGKGEGG